MYLSRLELQGFKTFSKKTSLDFTPTKGKNTLTVIVGPNGSGKSNLADAIRWCLGEQSLKQLRGKKTQDIIFSGSEGKSRSGFAEVSMTFNNEDRVMKVDYTEVTVTRRVYRDGESEYLLNGKAVRLQDIQLLLAEAGVGQRTYAVIGQGMIDHILTSSPEERKIFFDDATGVRGLQIKRHQAMLKLKKASENLVEVELLLSEIEPRLNSLKRQVKRLEKREAVEERLRIRQKSYYQSIWWDLRQQKERLDSELEKTQALIQTKQAEMDTGDAKLLEMEKQASTQNDKETALQEAQRAYKNAQKQLHDARQGHFSAERELELARVKSQTNWSPLPLNNIISELSVIEEDQEKVIALLKNVKSMEELDSVMKQIDQVFKRSSTLRRRLTRPNPEDFTPPKELVDAIASAKTRMEDAKKEVERVEQRMDTINKQNAENRTELFDIQRELRRTQQELHALEQKENSTKIEYARVETRIDAISKEMQEELSFEFSEQLKQKEPDTYAGNTDAIREEMLSLKRELEYIGAIDEETVKEFEDTKQRYEFLDAQVSDIRSAARSTEKLVDELDQKINKQSDKNFKAINKEFQKYFKILFGGGSASLIKLGANEMKEGDQKITLDRALEELAEEKVHEQQSETADAITARLHKRYEAVAGVEIQATPPGKKLKSLNLLSGGERALTSIALLSAIMATNPSPFVVLDEVDAALDESNTVRFAAILSELQKHTQFIVITHNRATMERGDVLYGVTMGDDGISNLVSVSMSDIEEQTTARR